MQPSTIAKKKEITERKVSYTRRMPGTKLIVAPANNNGESGMNFELKFLAPIDYHIVQQIVHVHEKPQTWNF